MALDGVSLGINEDERIGVVGRNGAGKSTRPALLVGTAERDSGRIARTSGLRTATCRRATCCRASSARSCSAPVRRRDVGTGTTGTFGGRRAARRHEPGLRRAAAVPRRAARVALTALLAAQRDIVLLDEPTNHLDIEAIEWLGRGCRNAAARYRGQPRPLAARHRLRRDAGGRRPAGLPDGRAGTRPTCWPSRAAGRP